MMTATARLGFDLHHREALVLGRMVLFGVVDKP